LTLFVRESDDILLVHGNLRVTGSLPENGNLANPDS